VGCADHGLSADRFPFSEWILDRIRKMGYPLDDLNYLHKAVPQPEVFKVTKQLCADTNLPSSVGC